MMRFLWNRRRHPPPRVKPVPDSPPSFFRDGPPPPRVVLLSDALFFTHVVAVADDASAGGPAGVAEQAELSLEALSPFLLNQLYYGYYWVPGSAKALVFAAYRRRFTVEQTAVWLGAEA